MPRVLTILALMFLGLYLLTGIAQVQPGEQALVRRFGRVVGVVGPGLHVGWPIGIDRVDRIAVGLVRQVTIGNNLDSEESPLPPGQFLTGDQNLVEVRVAVDYTVAEGDDNLVSFVLAEGFADRVVAQVAEASISEWIAAHDVDHVILDGKASLPRWLVPQLQERLSNHRLGLSVRSVSVTLLSPPAEVKPAFDRVAQAQANARARETDARRRAERTLNEAQIDQDRQAKLASAYADERQQLARADADSFRGRLTQYRQLSASNPAVLSAIWWDEIGRLLVRMRSRGRVEILDPAVGTDGLDITQFGPQPPKR